MSRLRRILLLLLCLVGSGLAHALGQAFDAAAFAALQKEGKPVLVAIHADWCPTCKAQTPIIDALLRTPEFRGLTVLRVDFDAQKEVVRSFKATMQSTLIVFKGAREVGRSTGETRQAEIVALLRKGL